MDSSIEYNDAEHIESHLTKSQCLEMAYKDTLRNADIIIKDEGARRLRLRILMLENENDDLHEQLALGDDRVDILEQEAEQLRTDLSHAQDTISRQEGELRIYSKELTTLKAELASLNGVTADSAKILTEKLSLARELATLKPELEHLRSQVSHQQNVLAEKLTLERQVNTLEVELETEKRAASKRAAQKNKINEREAELQNQVESLQKELNGEKKEREKARKEAEADLRTQVDDLQKDLAREKREKEKVRKEAELEYQSQLDDLQKDLAREKREKEKAKKDAERELHALENKGATLDKREKEKIRKEVAEDFESRLEDLRNVLAREKMDREKARREADKELKAMESKETTVERREREKIRKDVEEEYHTQLEDLRNDLARERKEQEKARKEADKDIKAAETKEAILESKIDDIRAKFRATKEQLKESQAELAEARAAAVKAPGYKSEAASKNNRKRTATEISADVAIGTPDGVADRRKRPTQRGRKDQTMVGEKSMFSITPFLNRTISIAPETPADDSEPEVLNHEDAGLQASKHLPREEAAEKQGDDVASTPTAAPKPRGRKKVAEKASAKAKTVLGEAKAGVKNKRAAPKKTRPVSTLEMVTEEGDENIEPELEQAQEKTKAPPKPITKVTKDKMASIEEEEPKKKKRKLIGGGKTLFDEDDGEAAKRPAKISLGVPRLLGKGGPAGPKGGMKGGIGNASGFGSFSPLKKDRRGVGASFLG